MTSQASHFVDMWLSVIYRPSKTNLKKTINLLQIDFSASSKQTKNWRSKAKKTINCEKKTETEERKPDKTQLSVERGVTIRNFGIQATTALHNIVFSRKNWSQTFPVKKVEISCFFWRQKSVKKIASCCRFRLVSVMFGPIQVLICCLDYGGKPGLFYICWTGA